MKDLSDEDRRWLSDVRMRTCDAVAVVHPHRQTTRIAVYQFTEEEWCRIQRIITEYELPCAMYAGPYGFGVLVYDHAPVQGVTPPVAYSFEYWQPFGFDRGALFQPEAARRLSAITHTPRNAELLAWYGMPPLREPEYYVY